MKLTSQEEYGLRCLLRIARQGRGGALTIPEISEAEGISGHYVAKLMRVLRRGGLVTSARGQAGGYTLSRPPERVIVGEALAVLGGRFFEADFCQEHSGIEKMCTHTVDCSIRSLWRTVQLAVDQVLAKTTLKDLVSNEQEMTFWVGNLVNISEAEKHPRDQLTIDG
jgi:Rrf2 family iron-sulfur cluster assembly transcriptional regulator